MKAASKRLDAADLDLSIRGHLFTGYDEPRIHPEAAQARRGLVNEFPPMREYEYRLTVFNRAFRNLRKDGGLAATCWQNEKSPASL